MINWLPDYIGGSLSTDYLLGDGGHVVVIRPLEEHMLHLQLTARLLRSYLVETDLEQPQPDRLETIVYTASGLLDVLESQLEPKLDGLTRTLVDAAVFTTAGNAVGYLDDPKVKTEMTVQLKKIIERTGTYAKLREQRAARAT